MKLQREEIIHKIALEMTQLLVVQPVKMVSVKKNKMDILLIPRLNKLHPVLLNVRNVLAPILVQAVIMVSLLIKQHSIAAALQEKSPISINLC